MIIDGRNLLDPDVLRSTDFEYVDMGRSQVTEQEAKPGRMPSPASTPKAQIRAGCEL